MLLLRQPSTDVVRRFLDGQRSLDFSYPQVGATAASPPAGFVVDHTRVQLGEGERVFDDARAAFERWHHFRLGWVEVLSPDVPLRTGEAVAVAAHFCGVWWLNACRIVYTVDEHGPVRRFGFAYGTLPDHVESGEERFVLEWNTSDGSVWYDILAFSRPRHLLARLGYPLVRRLQKRFARESAAAMRRVRQ